MEKRTIHSKQKLLIYVVTSKVHEKKDNSYTNDNMDEVKVEEPNNIIAQKEKGVAKGDPKPGNIKLW